MTDHGVPPGGPTDPLADTDLTLQEMVLQSRDINDFLAELAALAASRLSAPGNTIQAGVTVLRRKRPETAAGSDASAGALDEMQIDFGDGPCLTALRTQETVLVPDLRVEKRWTRYIAAAAAQGVLSILAVPLALAGNARAVLNLYSGRSNGFSSEDIVFAEAFGAQAASSVRLALRITELSEARHDLAAAISSRTLIDMALGAVMADHRCSREEAFTLLSKAASSRKMKLRDAAAAVVTRVSGGQEIRTEQEVSGGEEVTGGTMGLVEGRGPQ